MKIFVAGVGVLASGLHGWQASLSVLAGSAPYADTGLVLPPNDLLPSAERRRTGMPVKIALAVGCEAIAHARLDASKLATVFASSAGDGGNMHSICETLANNGREVSPTRFHNSVHNAPSGYWSIASHSMAPSTSLACYDASFAAGLIEASTQSLSSGNAVVLIAYDVPYPEPLHAVRPIHAAFGVALVLTPNQTSGSLAELEITIQRGHALSLPTPITDPTLEALRVGTPAARSLPVLAALANLSSTDSQMERKIYLNYLNDSHLAVTLRSC